MLMSPLTQPVDYSAPPALRMSEALHKRVRAFSQSFEQEVSLASDTFESLALDIARFQLRHSPGFARLCPLATTSLTNIDDLPVVPSDVFRLARVALHPPELDQAVFRTSGTTAALTGEHPMRTLATKEQLSLLQAKRTLFSDYGRGIVVALAQVPDGTSSLTHLMDLFMRHFDGRALLASPGDVPYSAHEPGRFLVNAGGVDLDGLKRAARLARHRAEPLYVLATSFAMFAALDALDGDPINAPARTKVMITGGFKGRSTTVDESELRRSIEHCFAISPEHIVGEYGMTELTSQLFEQPKSVAANEHGIHQAEFRTVARRESWWTQRTDPGRYLTPPWLKIRALSPQSYEPVPDGEPGLAHFIDLGNIDSCLSVVTQDMIRLTEGGIQLLGRAPQAEVRGCSLPFEALTLLGSAVRSS